MFPPESWLLNTDKHTMAATPPSAPYTSPLFRTIRHTLVYLHLSPGMYVPWRWRVFVRFFFIVVSSVPPAMPDTQQVLDKYLLNEWMVSVLFFPCPTPACSGSPSPWVWSMCTSSLFPIIYSPGLRPGLLSLPGTFHFLASTLACLLNLIHRPSRKAVQKHKVDLIIPASNLAWFLQQHLKTLVPGPDPAAAFYTVGLYFGKSVISMEPSKALWRCFRCWASDIQLGEVQGWELKASPAHTFGTN